MLNSEILIANEKFDFTGFSALGNFIVDVFHFEILQ